MIGRLNHVAIAVRDLEAASSFYRDVLGAAVSAPFDQPGQGVTVVFIELANTKVELIAPLGEASPIARWLDRHPSGGIHHVCYEVDDLLAARNRLAEQGYEAIGEGDPSPGAHGKPVMFLHPKATFGTLIELEEA